MRIALIVAILRWILAEDNFTDPMAFELLHTDKSPFDAKEDIFTTDDFGSFSPPPKFSNEAKLPSDMESRTTEVLPPAFSPQPPGREHILQRALQKNLGPKSAQFENRLIPPSETYGDTQGTDSAVLISKKQELNTDDLESSGEQKSGLSTTHVDSDDGNTDHMEGDPEGSLENDPVIQKQLEEFASAVKQQSDMGKTLFSSADFNVPSDNNSLVEGSRNSQSEILDNSEAVFPDQTVALRTTLPSPRTPPRRGAVEGCPAPVMCTKNCFVYINEHGCQDCQCLWQALACDVDDDCPEAAQFCDLGKCNCRPGLRQDMMRSGACEQDPDFKDSSSPNGIQEPPRRVRRRAEMLQEDKEKTLPLLPRGRHRSMNNGQQMSRHMNLGIHGSAPYLEDDVRPPAPPPKPGRVSRMLIDRSIAGTFPDLPPLEPLTRFISSSPNDKPFRKRNKNIVDEERRKGRKSDRLVEFPISSRVAAAHSEGVLLLPPLPLSVHPTKEELRRHNHFKSVFSRTNRRHWQSA
ncbi:hypothetical protein V3C99_018909 [Haemonchus contortus]